MKSALGSAREWAVPALPTHPFGRRVPTRGSTMRVGVFFRRGAATRVRSADALGGSRGRRSAPRSIARLPVACAGDSQYHRVTVEVGERGRLDRVAARGRCVRLLGTCAPRRADAHVPRRGRRGAGAGATRAVLLQQPRGRRRAAPRGCGTPRHRRTRRRRTTLRTATAAGRPRLRASHGRTAGSGMRLAP